MKALLMLLFLLPPQDDPLTLDYCYEQAYQNYPLRKQEALYDATSVLRIDNLGTSYLPQITLSGQATYQSEVPSLNFSTPLFTFPELSKDRYKALLEITQVVYDGGVTSSLKDITRNETLAEKQRVEVELYQLKQQVNDLYFGILVLQETVKQLELQYKTVKAQLDEIMVQIANGAVAGSNQYILEAQLIMIEQEILTAESGRKASIEMLGSLIDRDLNEQTALQLPVPNLPTMNITPGNRPEYKLFDYEKSTLDALKENVSTGSVPKLGAFGEFGYGKPGLNFLEDDFQSYYLVGLKISWDPINWGTNSNQEQIYDINKRMVDARKESLDKNIRISLEQFKEQALNLEQLIVKDREIIKLKEKIMISVSSQLQNGTITATDYLTELDSEIQAKINLETHIIQLVQTKINFLTTQGN